MKSTSFTIRIFHKKRYNFSKIGPCSNCQFCFALSLKLTNNQSANFSSGLAFHFFFFCLKFTVFGSTNFPLDLLQLYLLIIKRAKEKKKRTKKERRNRLIAHVHPIEAVTRPVSHTKVWLCMSYLLRQFFHQCLRK